MSAPASIRSRVPSAVTTLPATIGASGATARTSSIARSVRVWWPWAVSITSTSAPIASSALALVAGSPLMPTATATSSRPSRVDRRAVDRRAQRALARDAADQAAVAVDHRRHRQSLAAESGRRSRRRRCRPRSPSGRCSSRSSAGVKRSKPTASCSVKMPTGRAVVDDDHDAPWARLWISPSASPTVCVGLSVIGVSYTMWRDFTYSMTAFDDVERDVLRQHRRGRRGGRRSRPCAARRRRSCCRHDDRDRGAEPSGVREVDVEPRRHRRQARHHEHVAVGQVVRRAFVRAGAWQLHRIARSSRPRRTAQGYGLRTPSVTTCGRYGCGVAPPVVLVHGWGGSFESTWQRNGFTELLARRRPRR